MTEDRIAAEMTDRLGYSQVRKGDVVIADFFAK